MKQYHELLHKILNEGVWDGDRTGTGTLGIVGHQMRFNLQEGFPIVTSKYTPMKLIESELMWFLKGNKHIDYLHEHNNHIWDEWVKEDGTFGDIYGSQWRSWPDRAGGTIDQIANAICKLKNKPNDRRIIVSAWNVEAVEAGQMALPPCHCFFQMFSKPMDFKERLLLTQREYPAVGRVMSEDIGTPPQKPTRADLEKFRQDAIAIMDEHDVPERKLSCLMYQRSCDTFLGVPFNIASYALLTHMFAQCTDHAVGDFIWTGGDVHIYSNHMNQVKELLNKSTFTLPQLQIRNRTKNIDKFNPGDFKLIEYQSHGVIKAPVSV